MLVISTRSNVTRVDTAKVPEVRQTVQSTWDVDSATAFSRISDNSISQLGETIKMPSLSTIPSELVGEILFQLPQTDLYSVSRVSKYFNILTKSALYYSITWEGPSRELPIVPLLCTLFNRPGLCAHVKHVRFRNNFYLPWRLPESSNKDHSRVSLTEN